MSTVLSPSSWTIAEARGLTARLRHTAVTGPEYDGLELFGALTGYLDELSGGAGFDRLLPAAERAALVGRIRAARGHGVPVELSTTEAEARLDQPVNAAVTLAEGRSLAAELAAATGWQGELGRCLQALYSYLDHLYGGPGAFTELLGPDEVAEVSGE